MDRVDVVIYFSRNMIIITTNSFGNKPEGNLPASNGPPLSPPRTLRGPLLNLLLDDELQSCVPVIGEMTISI